MQTNCFTCIVCLASLKLTQWPNFSWNWSRGRRWKRDSPAVSLSTSPTALRPRSMYSGSLYTIFGYTANYFAHFYVGSMHDVIRFHVVWSRTSTSDSPSSLRSALSAFPCVSIPSIPTWSSYLLITCLHHQTPYFHCYPVKLCDFALPSLHLHFNGI